MVCIWWFLSCFLATFALFFSWFIQLFRFWFFDGWFYLQKNHLILKAFTEFWLSLIELKTLLSKHSLFLIGRNDTSSCPLIWEHKWNQPHNYRLNIPSWVPWLWMVVWHAHANPFVDFKSSIWCYHFNSRRLQRIFFWKNDRAEIATAFIWTICKVPNNIVPSENVVRIRAG